MDARAEACTHREDTGATHAPTHPDPDAIAGKSCPLKPVVAPVRKKDDSPSGPPAPRQCKVERQRLRYPALLPEKLRTTTRPTTLNLGVGGRGCALSDVGVFFFALTGTWALAFLWRLLSHWTTRWGQQGTIGAVVPWATRDDKGWRSCRPLSSPGTTAPVVPCRPRPVVPIGESCRPLGLSSPLVPVLSSPYGNRVVPRGRQGCRPLGTTASVVPCRPRPVVPIEKPCRPFKKKKFLSFNQ